MNIRTTTTLPQIAVETPPKTAGLPLIGSIPQVMRQQIRFFERSHQELGDVFMLDLGITNMLVLNHPDHAQHILRNHARNYTKGGKLWDMVRSLLGNGLPVSEGEFWMRQRRMMQPQFHRQRLQALTVHMLDAIQEGLDEWETLADSGQPVNIASEFANITMKVIVRTMFGTGLSREEVNTVTDNLVFVLDYMLRGLVTGAFPSWMPVPGRKRYQEAVDQIDEIVYGVIERHRQEGLSDDLLSMLLDLVDDETGEQMTDQQLRDEAVSIFLAGYETTAVSMSWSLYFLMKNPEMMQRLTDEVDETLEGREPTFADIPALTYPRWVMQEAMRLYNPVFFIWRKATDYDEIDGYAIEPGQEVAVMVHNVHRHQDFWHNPNEFDPERFSPEQAKGRHQLAWLPFGAGQRQCIGRDFALMEGQLILTKLIQRFRLEPAFDGEIEPHMGITLRSKDGPMVTIHRRN